MPVKQNPDTSGAPDIAQDGAQAASHGAESNDAVGNDLISRSLRTYYDELHDPNTPDHLLDLLEKLDQAEAAQSEVTE